MNTRYLNAIMSNEVTIKIDGTLYDNTGRQYPVDYSNIVNDSFSVTKKLCEKGINFGSANTSSMKIGIYFSDETIDRYRFIDGTIHLNFGVLVNEYLDENEELQQEWETVSCGVYNITSATKKDSSISFEGYDNMIKFNRVIESQFLDMKPYEIIQTCCTKCGVLLSNTEEEIEQFPNGARMVSLFQTGNETITYNNVLSDVIAVMGAYSYIDGDGRLYITQYETTPVRVIPPEWRFAYEKQDYDIEYSGLSYANVQSGKSYELGTENGTVYDFGANMFMQYGDEEEISTAYESILERSVLGKKYKPFSAKTPLDFSINIGDIISFDGMNAVSTDVAPITEITYNGSGAMTFKCDADNPLLKDNSQLSNASIAFAIQSSQNNVISYVNYENNNDITTASGESELCRLGVALDKKQCMLFGQVELDSYTDVSSTSSSYTVDDCIATISYYVNEEKVDEVKHTLRDGHNLLSLVYRIIDVQDANAFRFVATITTENGIATVEQFKSKWTAMAQASYETADTIEIVSRLSDTIDMVDMSNEFDVNNIAEALTYRLDIPRKVGVEDVVSAIQMNGTFTVDGVNDNLSTRTRNN